MGQQEHLVSCLWGPGIEFRCPPENMSGEQDTPGVCANEEATNWKAQGDSLCYSARGPSKRLVRGCSQGQGTEPPPSPGVDF